MHITPYTNIKKTETGLEVVESCFKLKKARVQESFGVHNFFFLNIKNGFVRRFYRMPQKEHFDLERQIKTKQSNI